MIMTDLPHELIPMPAFLTRLIRTIDRLHAAGLEPAAVAIPVMPGADPSDQPNSTCYGLPVLWLPHNESGRVLVAVPTGD